MAAVSDTDLRRFTVNLLPMLSADAETFTPAWIWANQLGVDNQRTAAPTIAGLDGLAQGFKSIAIQAAGVMGRS